MINVRNTRGDLDRAQSYYAMSLIEKTRAGDQAGIEFTMGTIGSPLLTAERFADAREAEERDEARWAQTALAIHQLKITHARDALIRRRLHSLDGTKKESFDELAERLRIATNALHQAHHKAKARLRDTIEHEVKDTVKGDAARREELAILRAALLRRAVVAVG